MKKIKKHHLVIGAGIGIGLLALGWFSSFTNFHTKLFKASHGLPQGEAPSLKKTIKAGTVSPSQRQKTIHESLFDI